MAPLPHPTQCSFCLTYILLASTQGHCAPQLVFPLVHVPSQSPLLLIGSGNFSAKTLPVKIPQKSHPGYSFTYPAYPNGTECSKTWAYKIRMLENHPKGIIQQSEHGQILKSKTNYNFFFQGADRIQQAKCKATTHLNHAIILKVMYLHCVLYMCSVIHNTLTSFPCDIFGLVN
jgi:hypothetical protein